MRFAGLRWGGLALIAQAQSAQGSPPQGQHNQPSTTSEAKLRNLYPMRRQTSGQSLSQMFGQLAGGLAEALAQQAGDACQEFAGQTRLGVQEPIELLA